ncbi:VWA domain-containing protein [Marinomonas sp. M1K-6]|uniref:VWA domain-containing protein n=1 Tax=Marinomonas profundi TaxID=2726122 RepID=A0A847R3S5_9GAMM|nr:vWA domain-containing protein [Marinomonas profundi]NLQ18605.1 VWA domain-containing protein [Marinomonas profundi]UDV02901.1 VWA domain-containing protein [Marinomonas profundi]
MKWLKVNTVLLVAVLSFWASFSQADTQFRVIVDASGSMLISDPDKLTSEALRLISSLAPEKKASLGIWLFGEKPRVLLPEDIINKANKAKLASYVDSYVTQDVGTDLEAIIRLLLETPDSGDLSPEVTRHWILVTDGMVDISLDDAVNKASRDRILNELTEKLEARGIHLHSISMTGYTDKALLESLSLRTNAIYTEVALPEDLLDAFERIFTQASPSDELPFDGNRFLVDDSIEELTLLVFHENNSTQPIILQPNDITLPLVNKQNVSVSVSDHYTLVTVLDPAAGEWQVNNVDIARSSVRVMTDLSAQATSIAPVIFENEAFSSAVGLFQSDSIIKDDAVLTLVDVTQTLRRLSGETEEAVFTQEMRRTSGQFEQQIEGIIEPGNYELVSVVDGQTFSRQLSQYFTVHPAIEFSGSHPGDNLVSFVAKPVNLKLNVLRSNIKLEFSYNNGTTKTEEMPLIGQGHWEKILPVSPNERMKVRAQLMAMTQAGLRFDYWTPYWHVYREGDNPPVVGQGEQMFADTLLAPVASSNDSVQAMSVAPSISVVDDAQDSPDVLAEANGADADESKVDKTENEADKLSAQEWTLYVILNVGAIFIIGAGVLLYRRMKKNKSIERDDLDDV